MRVKARVFCEAFPCKDVDHEGYVVPGIDIRPSDISIVMISEASPPTLGTTTTLEVVRYSRKLPFTHSRTRARGSHP